MIVAGCSVRPPQDPVKPEAAVKRALPAGVAFPQGPGISVLEDTGEPVERYVLSPEELAEIEAVNSDPNSVTVGVPWTGEMAITESVAQIMARDAATAQPRDGDSILAMPEREIHWRRERPSAEGAPEVSQWPPMAAGQAQVNERPGHEGDPRDPQTVDTSFNTVTISTSGFIPPDTCGDVGPTQYLAVVNGRVRVSSKTGAPGTLNTTLTTFFNSVRGGSTVGDPWVRYDRLTSRWFVVAITTSTPNRIVLAVSDGPTVTSTTDFDFYFFQHDLVGTTPNADTGGFADYPSLGVDNNALYLGANIFNPGYIGTTGYVVRKSSMLSGGPIVVTAFRQMATGAGNGPYSPRGVQNDNASATEGYIIGVSNTLFSQLVMRRISTPGGTPTISGNILITVPTTQFPTAVSVLGSTRPLDPLDDRLFEASIYLNQFTGERTLWTAHNFRVTSAGVATAAGTRVGSRWYELENLTGTPAVLQSGTVFDPAAADFDKYWIPSVAMSLQGHAALGCSIGGTLRRAEIAVVGRLAGDTLGTMQTPTIAQTSATDYNVEVVGTQRWGDYSATSVDPTDGMTIWTIQEYCNANNSWACRAFKLLAPSPVTPTSASPPSVMAGATGVDVDLTGPVVLGSGFFDPDPSYPNHISALVNGGGVTVNSVTFVDPMNITLNIDVSAGAATGARTITVTNPDGQMVTSGGILTVVPACALLGDMNVDTNLDSLDVQDFADCMVTGTSSGNCACGDFDGMNMVDPADTDPFIDALGV